ncbi:hypothetical protein TREMEDRAFT_30253, partial [Tremella mesenterica DSM 1558]|uniref:uncharacterized protein n=1 Tax=Tremella mesenterica (strain ATCC 24925 / CBS 8224 / DSM 1558 / NBRC 9311 / NRRL Y-6157 / RJB 2259-6 / UBC 559-6) TaxID=578456 RepID=UPI0003F490D6
MPPPSFNVAGASRKQNVACDSCRAKKIKCQRTVTTETCEQCVTKGCDCTSFYIEQLQAKIKKSRPRPDDDGKNMGRKRRRKSLSVQGDDLQAASGNLVTLAQQARDVWQDSRPSSQSSSIPVTWGTEASGSQVGGDSWSVEPLDADRSLHLLANLAPSKPPTLATTLPHQRPPSVQQSDLLKYLFSPTAVHHHDWQYTDLDSLRVCDQRESDLWEEMGGHVWVEQPSQAHLKLTDEGYKDFADDLIETFFSIVHIRFPMLDGLLLRARLTEPDTHPKGPVSHGLVAVAIAWGSRFSDHPTIIADRQEVSARDQKGSGRSRSRICQLLVIRAREVVEASKMLRIPSVEAAQTLMLLEPLVARDRVEELTWTEYQPVAVSAAIKHMLQLGLNSPAGVFSLKDESDKTAAAFVWWTISLSDGFRAAFHRLKPTLSDADYDLAPPEDAPLSFRGNETEGKDTSVVQDTPTEAVAWFGAANAGAFMCRRLCEGLWIPRSKEYGITTPVLASFVRLNLKWRDQYLTKLGVPSKWPDSWDFLAAITACSTDVYYHCLWLVVWRAMEEFGLEETRTGRPASEELVNLQSRIKGESEHGAMRIAALIAVLTENGYLRLDPLILYHPIYEAGCFLANMGRMECLACIAGMKQYSIAYPQMWDFSIEIENIYTE